MRDSKQFEKLVRDHQGLMRWIAFRILGNTQLTEDAVQNAFLAAFKYGHTFDHAKASIQTWLARITRNIAGEIRFEESRHFHADLTDEVLERAVCNEDSIETAEDIAQLQAAIATLNPQFKAVVNEHLSGTKHRQIAENLGISESSSKVSFHRAKTRLREILFGRN